MIFAALAVSTALLGGYPKVIDGDTLDLGGERIRIWGVDAPEGRQTCKDAAGKDWPCGEAAATALRTWIGRKELSCTPVERDPYGRQVARCRVAGQDVGSWLVAAGWGLDYTAYSRGAHAGAERAAKAAKLGIWRGTFQPPWEWRASAGSTSTAAGSPTASGCQVKGNISSSGTKIFHVPGQADYASVVITPSKGERWFCSAADAVEAGWRPAAR